MNEIDPGQGWRLLKEGEVVQEGDEFFHGGSFHVVAKASIGYKVIGREMGGESEVIRRRIEDRWIPLSERLPDKFPCEATNDKIVWVLLSYADFLARQQNMLRWKPLKLSDPPEPEVSEASAFEEWFKTHRNTVGFELRTITQEAWNAALKHRENKS